MMIKGGVFGGRVRCWLILLSVMFLLLMMLAERDDDSVRVVNGYVRELIPGQKNTAAFMMIKNNTEREQVLLSVIGEGVDRIELHRHVHTVDGMSMERVSRVAIAAGESFEFLPGEYHVMIIGVMDTLSVGGSMLVRLVFADGREIKFSLPVRAY